MDKKIKFRFLDKILKLLLEKSMYENPVRQLDKIDFLKNLSPEELIELQSCLIKDSFVVAPSDSHIKLLPLKINNSGADFISKGGYIQQMRKEKTEKLKTTIILSGVIFSIFLGIITTSISIINYIETKNDQKNKIIKLQQQVDKMVLEMNSIKNQIKKD